ncbi:hypothetical protein Hanom_Chr12g01155611 [Helianthus anomalus]
MFTNINERTRPLFMFVHLAKRTEFRVRVRLFNKRTNTNELPAERFTKCSPNVWFVYSPTYIYYKIELNFRLVPMVCKNYRLCLNGLLITRVVPNLVKNKLVWSPTLTSVKYLC